MGYLAVDADGTELYFRNKPERAFDTDYMFYSAYYWADIKHNNYKPFILEDGTTKKILGKDMSWKDEPFEVICPSMSDISEACVKEGWCFRKDKKCDGLCEFMIKYANSTIKNFKNNANNKE